MGLWIHLLYNPFQIQIKRNLLQVTVFCGFPFISWVNNPEVIEFFKFLNPQIKLPDRKILSTEILSNVVKDIKIMFKDNLHFPF